MFNMAAVFPDVSSALFYAGPVFSIALQLSKYVYAAQNFMHPTLIFIFT